MNILITGIHGFVGSNLVFYLQKIHKIYGVDIIFPVKDGVETTFQWKDLDNPEQFYTSEEVDKVKLLRQIDIIIHLAGKAHDTKNEAQAQEYFDINTGLTRKAFDFFLQSNAKKFIFFQFRKSSC